MTVCPSCGHELTAPPELRVDMSTGALVYKDLVVALTPSQAILMVLLIEKMPEAVSTDDCLGALYGDGLRHRADGGLCLRVFLHGLRKKLRGTTLSIETRRGRGFSLHIPEPEETL